MEKAIKIIGTIIGWGGVALTGTWIGVAEVFGSVFACVAE